MKIKKEEGISRRERELVVRRDFYILFFLLFAFFLDLWKSDCRFSSGLKAKLIHAARATHRNCFRTVRVKISELFLDSPNRIFVTIFRQFGTCFRFGFDLGTDVFGFYGVFWYPNNSMTNREGTKRCHVLCGSEI